MLQQTYAFEVTEGMPSHTVVGKVEATDADSLPENRVINYQLRAPQSEDGASSSSSSSDIASAISANAALHFFTIDRYFNFPFTSIFTDKYGVEKKSTFVIYRLPFK